MAKKDLIAVVQNRLNEQEGMVAEIRHVNFDSLGASKEMIAKIRVVFENIIRNLATLCASPFGEIYIEVFESLAPKICPHFNLAHHTTNVRFGIAVFCAARLS